MLGKAAFALLIAGGTTAIAAVPRDLATTVTELGHLAGGLSVVTSPDCSRLALVTHAGYLTADDRQNYDERWAHGQDPIRLVVDGKATLATDQLTQPTFSADSRHIGYAIKCHDKWHIVEDDKVLIADADNIPGDQGQGSPIVFSPDSQHVATLVEKDYRWHAAVDGKEWPGGGVSMPTCGLMSFSPDSQHLVVVGRTKNSMVIYEDGVPVPLPPQDGGGNAKALARIFPLYVWEPDSSAIGYYGAFPDHRWQVFTTEPVPFESAQYDGIMQGSPQFSPDSKRLVFVARERGKWVVMTDDRDAKPVLVDAIYGLSVVFLAPENERENSRLVYLAQRAGKWNLYVNQKPVGAPFGGILDGTFTVSPDKKHFAFVAVPDNAGGGQGGEGAEGGWPGERRVLVRDGKAVEAYAEVAPGTLAFSPDSQHLAYAVEVKGRWRVCVDKTVGTADFAVINESPIAFSPNSKQVAFTAELNRGASRLYVGMDAEYESGFYDTFLRGCAVGWRDNSSLATIGVAKMVAYRVEAKVPAADTTP